MGTELVVLGGEVLPALDEGTALVRSYLATLSSPRSVSTMTESCMRVARVLKFPHFSAIPWTKLSLDDLAGIRRRLDVAYPPGTVNLTLSAVRGVLREAADRELVTEGFLAAARRKLKNVGGSRISAGRALSNEELARLEDCARAIGGTKGPMMRSILLLSVGVGLRRAEICALFVDAASVPGELRVIGKGNKERICPLDEPTSAVLEEWLVVRRQLGWIHRRLFGAPKHRKPLTEQTVWWLLSELGEAAGVSFAPHDLRRTFASRMLGEGLDLREVQVLMGHASPQTTARYDKRDPERLAERRRAVRAYVRPEKGA
jgi:integrase/recombinase XerD